MMYTNMTKYPLRTFNLCANLLMRKVMTAPLKELSIEK